MLKSASLEQLSLDLTPLEKFSLDYFVAHTGVVSAFETLKITCDRLYSSEEVFSLLGIFGHRGSGKSHIVHGFVKSLIAKGYPEAKILVYDFSDNDSLYEKFDDPDWVREFVDRYERSRASGGLIVIASRANPLDACENPHLRSRLHTGHFIEVVYPSDAELQPLVGSLLEKRNLRLSEADVAYLVKRLPSNPLYFDQILARVNRLSLAQGKPARRGLLREALAGMEESGE